MGFRAKLLLSYIVISVVTLLLGMALFAFVFKQIQDDATARSKQRLQTVTGLISRDIGETGPYGQTLPQYQNRLEGYAQLLNVRILIVDEQGYVWVDSDTDQGTTMLRQTIPNYQLVPRDRTAHNDSRVLRDVKYFYYAQPGPSLLKSTATLSQVERVDFRPALVSAQAQANTQIQTDLWLAVPEANLNAGWNQFLPGLGLAGLISLVVSVILSLVIGRSLARPLTRMTKASREIAQGQFNQQLPEQGRDEMATLARSFNQMAREVAQSQQTIRDFVANVSHELKTPLTSIQGFSQAITEGVADDPATLEHSAQVIYEEAARMRRLVDELLDLSRIESGQIALNRQIISLNTLLERVAGKLQPLAMARQLTIITRLTPELFVTGDADRLEQVFTNIIDNAIKYSREASTVWIDGELTGTNLSADGGNPLERPGKSNRQGGAGTVQVRIANMGPLIPAEQLPRIFERFYKLDRSRRRRGESTGLGLAIAKELIEAQRGTVAVTSQPTGPEGEGLTVFTISFPLANPIQADNNGLDLARNEPPGPVEGRNYSG